MFGVSVKLALLGVLALVLFTGCSRNNDTLKTSNCSATFKYNCECDYEKSLITEALEKTEDIIK